MKLKILSLSIIMLAISGCTTALTAYKSRSMSKHGILYKDKFYNGEAIVLTGDRRIAIAIPRQPKRDYWFCTEALPDVAAAAAATSNTNIDSTLPNSVTVKGGISEQFSQALLKTFTRTENAELFRNWNFAFCLFSAQGKLSDAKSHEAKLFADMTTGIIEVMKENAKRGSQPPATEGAVNAGNSGTPAKNSSVTSKPTDKKENN